jgi:hypothetical protein
MENIKKIVYIGAGKHIECTKHFPNTKVFVFVDTQPRSEHDSLSFCKRFYRGTFFEDLLYECRRNYFRLFSIRKTDKKYYKKILNCKQYLYYKFNYKTPFLNPTLLTFMNDQTKQIIYYYISTNIEYNLIPELLLDIQTSDALIVSGHFPHKVLFNYFNQDNPKKFIGYSESCFKMPINKEDDDANSIIAYLQQSVNENIEQNPYFSSYYYVDYDNGSSKKYDTFKEFLQYSKH